MKTQLHPPIGIHELGRRENNEDCIYPNKEHQMIDENRLFLVCDGVGGLEKGEVASRIVCETFADILRKNQKPSAKDINYTVQIAEQRIDQYIQGNSDSHGMATTMTMLLFHDEGATIAHIGDSRVYHIRNKSILHRTEDHSLVNELVMKKIITPDEALTHPRRNVITKAISGYADHQIADIYDVSDLQKGDYFFLCSDGILESVSDDKLIQIIGSDESNETKIDHIESICADNSKDNYSAYLVQIKSLSSNLSIGSYADWIWSNQSKVSNILFVFVFIVVGVVLGLYVSGDDTKDDVAIEKAKTDAALKMLDAVDTNEISAIPESSFPNADTTSEESSLVKINEKGKGSVKKEVLNEFVEPKNKIRNESSLPHKIEKKILPENKIVVSKETLKQPIINKSLRTKTNIEDSYGQEEAADLKLQLESSKKEIDSSTSVENVDLFELEVEQFNSGDKVKSGSLGTIEPDTTSNNSKLKGKNNE